MNGILRAREREQIWIIKQKNANCGVLRNARFSPARAVQQNIEYKCNSETISSGFPNVDGRKKLF